MNTNKIAVYPVVIKYIIPILVGLHIDVENLNDTLSLINFLLLAQNDH